MDLSQEEGRIQRLSLDKRSLAERSYDLLREEILSGHLKPGDKIDIDELADTLGISRTPVKESVGRLAHEGFITIQPRRGSFVAGFEPRRLLELLELRFVLEVGLAPIAVEHVNSAVLTTLRRRVEQMDEHARTRLTVRSYPAFTALDQSFHGDIIAITNNSEAVRVYENLRTHIQIGRVFYGAPTHLDATLREHRQILAALEARDALRLQQELARHIRRVIEYITAQTGQVRKVL